MHYAFLKFTDISVIVDGAQPLQLINPKSFFDFSSFPSRFIYGIYPIVDARSPIPKNNIINNEYNNLSGTNISEYTFCYSSMYNLIHFKHVYFGMYSDLYSEDGTYYRFDFFCGEPMQKKVVCGFANVAGLTVSYTWEYGDLINGLLIRLANMPVDILQFCVLPISDNTNYLFIQELINAIDIKGCKVVLFNQDDVIFADNLYTILPDKKFVFLHMAFFGEMAKRFGDICRRGFKTDVKPFDFVLYNRYPGMRRHFTNFEEIKSVVKEMHPEYNYTTIIGHFGSLQATVKRYSVIKWLFAVAGSNCMNVLFMGLRTNVLMFNTVFDEPAVMCALAREINLVAYTNSSCKQVGEPFPLPIEQFKPYLDLSFKLLKERDSQ